MVFEGRFSGRVSVVAGGGGNIGGAICRRLASEGAKVAVVDINSSGAESVASQIGCDGGTAVAIEADLRSRRMVEEALERVPDAWGEVDLLVNSAGVDYSTEPAAISDDEWDRVIDSNLRLPFLTCQTLVRSWLANGTKGAIVNIASVESVMPFPRQVHYASSKGGVQMMTRALALDLAPAGIRVNAVGPGTVPRRGEPAERYESYHSQYPLGRLGTGDDIAAAVAFLASDDASWITGQTLYVDGGWLVR